MAKITRGVSSGEAKGGSIMIDDGIWWLAKAADGSNAAEYHKFVLQETSTGSGLYFLKDVQQETDS